MAISDVRKTGSFYDVFDENGKKIKSISAGQVGDLCGVGNDFILFIKGDWYNTYDEKGQKLATGGLNPHGDFRSVVGSNMNFKKGDWVTTYDKKFKRLNQKRG